MSSLMQNPFKAHAKRTDVVRELVSSRRVIPMPDFPYDNEVEDLSEGACRIVTNPEFMAAESNLNTYGQEYAYEFEETLTKLLKDEASNPNDRRFIKVLIVCSAPQPYESDIAERSAFFGAITS